jgi:apolipoprotein N-acyltransferase
VEEGLPVVRATPTGISALIDARGGLVAQIAWRQQGVIDARLPPAAPPTLFARAGNLMPFLFALLLVAAALLAGRLQSGTKRATERRT